MLTTELIVEWVDAFNHMRARLQGPVATGATPAVGMIRAEGL